MPTQLRDDEGAVIGVREPGDTDGAHGADARDGDREVAAVRRAGRDPRAQASVASKRFSTIDRSADSTRARVCAASPSVRAEAVAIARNPVRNG
jgi:hypothetical protein